ncbi:MAG: glycosyltransferase [Dorea sp.]|nr:glycosyltransferase [Dorea sp.]
MNERKTFAVVVTYNREKYLRNLYERLLEIDELDGIFILNNNGNDNTDVIFENANLIENKVCKICRNRKDIYYYRNDCNLGGAGGFRKAFELVCGYEWDYLWIMDDDVFPEKDCLSKLLKNVEDRFKVCIPNRTDEGFEDFACIKYDLSNPFKFRMKNRVKVISCNDVKKETIEVFTMPFEGPLIAREVIQKVGLPDDKYFIIYDDSDYCRRCLKYTRARMVMDAKLHKQIIPIASDEVNWKNYYAYRNCFAFDHKYCTNKLAREVRPWLIAHSLMIKTYITKDILRFKVLRKAYQDYKAGVMGKVITIENFKEMF